MFNSIVKHCYVIAGVVQILCDCCYFRFSLADYSTADRQSPYGDQFMETLGRQLIQHGSICTTWFNISKDLSMMVAKCSP